MKTNKITYGLVNKSNGKFVYLKHVIEFQGSDTILVEVENVAEAYVQGGLMYNLDIAKATKDKLMKTYESYAPNLKIVEVHIATEFSVVTSEFKKWS